MHRVLAIFGAFLALSACASIVRGSSQTIYISTPPADQASCTLTTTMGEIGVITPGTVSVPRSRHDIAIKCRKAGWENAAGAIPSGTQAWTAGNIIFGGIVGVGVDAATGAINQYPEAFQLPMIELPEPKPVGKSPDTPAKPNHPPDET